MSSGIAVSSICVLQSVEPFHHSTRSSSLLSCSGSNRSIGSIEVSDHIRSCGDRAISDIGEFKSEVVICELLGVCEEGTAASIKSEVVSCRDNQILCLIDVYV